MKNEGNPVLDIGGESYSQILTPSVINNNGTYMMWYTSYVSNYFNTAIFLATLCNYEPRGQEMGLDGSIRSQLPVQIAQVIHPVKMWQSLSPTTKSKVSDYPIPSANGVG